MTKASKKPFKGFQPWTPPGGRPKRKNRFLPWLWGALGLGLLFLLLNLSPDMEDVFASGFPKIEYFRTDWETPWYERFYLPSDLGPVTGYPFRIDEETKSLLIAMVREAFPSELDPLLGAHFAGFFTYYEPDGLNAAASAGRAYSQEGIPYFYIAINAISLDSEVPFFPEVGIVQGEEDWGMSYLAGNEADQLQIILIHEIAHGLDMIFDLTGAWVFPQFQLPDGTAYLAQIPFKPLDNPGLEDRITKIWDGVNRPNYRWDYDMRPSWNPEDPTPTVEELLPVFGELLDSPFITYYSSMNIKEFWAEYYSIYLFTGVLGKDYFETLSTPTEDFNFRHWQGEQQQAILESVGKWHTWLISQDWEEISR